MKSFSIQPSNMKILCLLSVILFLNYVKCVRISEQKCKEYAELIRHKREVEDLSYGFFPLPGKIPADIRDFPHMVKIGFEHYEGEQKVTWGCGGSLISDQYVLTAANCRNFGLSFLLDLRRFTNQKDLQRRAKAPIPENLELPSNNSPAKWIKLGDKTKDEKLLTIEEIILHPNMTPPLLYNDVALLKLNKKVNFTEFIRPACLYSGNEDITNKSVIATGWGTLGVGHYYSDDLMKLDMEVISQEQCKKEYADAPETYLKRGVVDTQMCVGSYKGKKALCPGDAGTPYQIKSEKYKDMNDIVGIVSFGYYCNVVKIPILSTRIRPYIPWIENVIWHKNNEI